MVGPLFAQQSPIRRRRSSIPFALKVGRGEPWSLDILLECVHGPGAHATWWNLILDGTVLVGKCSQLTRGNSVVDEATSP